MAETTPKVNVKRIAKAKETNLMVFFFSIMSIVLSSLLYHYSGSLLAGLALLVVLLYILSVPQTRIGFYLAEENLFLVNLLGKKIIDLKRVQDIKIVQVPLITFPFLTNGIGYHMGRPRLKGEGPVVLYASAIPARALLLSLEGEKVAFTPARPEELIRILDEQKKGTDISPDP